MTAPTVPAVERSPHAVGQPADGAPGLDIAEVNQRGLAAELAILARRLRSAAGLPSVEAPPAPAAGIDAAEVVATGVAAGLDLVAASFDLTPFERDTLLLVAAPELDAGFGELLAQVQGGSQRRRATFALALAALPGAHWSATSPAAPLRRWRLVRTESEPPSVAAGLRVDEYVLHLLAGASVTDAALTGLARPVASSAALPPSQAEVAAGVARAWSAGTGSEALLPVLVGGDPASRDAHARCAAAYQGLDLLVVDATALPAGPVELAAVARLVERTCVLEARAALVEVGDPGDTGDARTGWGGAGGTGAEAALRLADDLDVPVTLSCRDPLAGRRRPLVAVDVRRPAAAEQRDLWRALLGDAVADGRGLDRVVGSFDLQPHAIRSAVELMGLGLHDATGPGAAVWDACRRSSRPRLEALALRVEPSVTLDDLVVPDAIRDTLAEMVMQVRHRSRVLGEWGMRRDGRGLSTTALFTGLSGTGKTMAAEAVAAELALDMYRVDLSAVVSKYIGETEKNLRRLFDAAEDAAAVLVFDEADALFGQRTEVKDSHDRYANVEVSYLLQRVEAYRGAAILTTNFKDALDKAFLRRIRFVCDFPFPDAAARRAIWERAFAPATPVDDLDLAALSRLNLSGGGIRSVAVRAAFLAADAGTPVTMDHVRRGARAELAKLGLSYVDG